MTDLPRDDGPSLQEAIFSYISRSSLTTSARVGKKQIYKHIQSSQNNQWTNKDVKRALKQLLTQEKIHKEAKEFFIPKSNTTMNNSKEEDASDASEPNDDSSGHGQPAIVPIAQRMRHQQQSQKYIQIDDDHGKLRTNNGDAPKESKQPLQLDLDEEIRRLEAELAADSATDDESDDDDDDHEVTTNDIQSTGVICLSETAHERIEPLPPAAMPQITRKTNADPAEANKRHKQQQRTLHEGIRHAVNDVLANYKTRSEVQQTPWYCRVCQYQAEDQAGFLSHRDSVFHTTAVSEHKKTTFCKLCRKQMTSAVQFQEHLRSRPHRELLAGKRAQHQQRNGRGGGNGMSTLGRGAGRAYGRGGGSQRQWC